MNVLLTRIGIASIAIATCTLVLVTPNRDRARAQEQSPAKTKQKRQAINEDFDEREERVRERELQFVRREMEIRQQEVEIQAGLRRGAREMLELAASEDASAVYAIATLADTVEAEEAIELLDKWKEQIKSPIVRRAARLKLAELSQIVQRREDAVEHLEILILPHHEEGEKGERDDEDERQDEAARDDEDNEDRNRENDEDDR